MKNIIKEWFTNSKTKASNKSVTDNTICFTLDEDNEVKINLMFGCNSTEAAENMGQFLYELNSGMISKSIVNLMIELGKDNPNYQIFIRDAILSWFNKLPKTTTSKENNPDEPLIKPSEFMNAGFKGS